MSTEEIELLSYIVREKSFISRISPTLPLTSDITSTVSLSSEIINTVILISIIELEEI